MTEQETRSPDGRRRRSETSRDRIVAAMLELVEAGDVAPSAEQVATRAGVGLRTVFRHFHDMESLYAAMTATLARHYEKWMIPFESSDWRGQLDEMIERRLTTFERLMPFKRAADARRHASPTIQAEHRRILAMMRARLHSILPDAITADELVFETIDLMLSVETWQRLRRDQGLTPATARALVDSQIERLTGPVR